MTTSWLHPWVQREWNLAWRRWKSYHSRPAIHVQEELLSLLSNSQWLHHQKRSLSWQELPIGDYETMKPWIDMAVERDPSLLIGRRQKLVGFALTSGTTGSKKWIPWTKLGLRLLQRQWKEWGWQLYARYPEVCFGKFLQLSSGATESWMGWPVSDLSGLALEHQGWLGRSLSLRESMIQRQTDQQLKYLMFLLRFALHPQAKIMVTATPSSLLAMNNLLIEHYTALAKSLHEGRIVQELHDRWPALANVHMPTVRGVPSSQVSLQQWFPHIRVVTTWLGGTMARFTTELQSVFSEAKLFDLGYIASEGFFTLPQERDIGCLRTGDMLFEATDQGRVFPLHDVPIGQACSLVVSSINGLLRYPMNDRVEIVERRDGLTWIRFLHKSDEFCDLTGEKLSSHHADQVLQRLFQKFPSLTSSAYLVADHQRYDLAVESGRVSESQKEVMLTELDRQLCDTNFIYAEHRSLGKLQSPKMKELVPGSRLQFETARRLRMGASVEQYKESVLIHSPEDQRSFRSFLQNLQE